MEKPGYPFGAAARKAGASFLVPALVLLAAAVVAVRAAHAAPPSTTVSFNYEPATPLASQRVTFTSTSTVSKNNSIVAQLWDLNGDGVYGDATGATATRSFAAGKHTVGLRVVDVHPDHVHVATRTITVVSTPPQNQPPVASFVYYPSSPSTGTTVNFYSTSTDPDSPIASQTWDLDGDGRFVDVAGPAATRSFSTGGTYTIGLRVVDTRGAASEVSQTVEVENPSQLNPSQAGAKSVGLLSPFPVVRLSGIIGRRGVRVRRLTVSGPSGLSILLRCRGHRCPFKKYSLKNYAPGKSRVSRSGREVHIARVLRLRRLERRLLPVGVRLQLFITKPHMIGKYTRFRIRRGRPPARVDRCLVPGARAPRRCPAS